ncbi:hypothetical protein KGF57_002873 [Candida theae]|uniref:Exosome complex protein n=1 Tax=Candida theae TaxID=1198502 RepID=A0AAD5FYI2_9ASCO|nr:uncharacterized protein KGF57_002873 [Candida theae]KAI5958065.1 hypothetical protein KGF57_002873 [Candida theae]
MENLDNIKLYLKSLDQSLSQYESTLEPLLSRTLDEHLAQQSSPQEKIKFLNNFQYVLISTIYSYLKTIGIDTDTHPIKKELARVKSYMTRAKNVDQKSNQHDESTTNKAKTKEFITRTLGVKNGVENTVGNVGPAISTQNFQGTHTKFNDDDVEDDDDDDESGAEESRLRTSSEPKEEAQIESIQSKKHVKSKIDKLAMQKGKSKQSKNKVTKPKHGNSPKPKKQKKTKG